MPLTRVKRNQKMLLVGLWVNRNWILGNWIKEVRLRLPSKFKVTWVPSIYSGRHWWEKLAHKPLGRYGSYFFSYPTLFEHYFRKDRSRFGNKSIVLFPHYESEMGSVSHLGTLLNSTYCVYFYCSRDMELLISNGLEKDKARLALCAVDVDCVSTGDLSREEKTIILASKFGPRKGLSILPELVSAMPDWRFVGLGRDWDSFINSSSLKDAKNFHHEKFDKTSRNDYFSRTNIFLSLSSLEGGPVPLIEAIKLGCKPIATDTGFARDVLEDGVNGIIIPVNPTVAQVKVAILRAEKLAVSDNAFVNTLTWDRITTLTIQDHYSITNEDKSRSN